MERWTNRQTNRQVERQRERERERDKQDRQADRQTGRQADRHLALGGADEVDGGAGPDALCLRLLDCHLDELRGHRWERGGRSQRKFNCTPI